MASSKYFEKDVQNMASNIVLDDLLLPDEEEEYKEIVLDDLQLPDGGDSVIKIHSIRKWKHSFRK